MRKLVYAILALIALAVLVRCDLQEDEPAFDVSYNGEYFVFIFNEKDGVGRLLITWGEQQTSWQWSDVSDSVGSAADVEIDVRKVLGAAYPDGGELKLELFDGDLVASDVAPFGDDQALVTWSF